MKQYRLIKEYPDSLKLGVILKQKVNNSPWYYQIDNDDIFRGSNEIENHPEFWEEICLHCKKGIRKGENISYNNHCKCVEKDYEILSFIATKEHGLEGHILTVEQINKLKSCSNGSISYCFEVDKYIENKSNFWDIHSVKRLSDGEIFTVGDNTNKGIIKEFLYYNTTIHVSCKKENQTCYFSGNIDKLQHIKKLLFTTEDGVEIFEGDVVTVISLKDFEEGDCDGENDEPIKAYSITWEDKKISTSNWNLRKDNFLQFSTKEAAEEYILMNKPCLSFKEIHNILKNNLYEYMGFKYGKNTIIYKEIRKLIKLKQN